MMHSLLAELGVTIPVGIVKALQMAREIVDGDSKIDLPTEATNVVAMLAGQRLQLHAQLQARPASRRSAAERRAGPASGDDPWYRAGRRDRTRRVGNRSKPVLVRAPIRRLARADPATKFEWWQGTLGAHYQDGRPISAAAPGCRRNRARPIRQGETQHGRSALRRIARRKPARVASVAIANKMARIAWAVTARGGVFERGHAPMLAAA